MRLRDAVIEKYEVERDSVSSPAGFITSPQALARGIGVGRLAIGGTFLLAPRLSVRILGVDAATAKRMTFLARMTAARDIGLGVGTLMAGDGPAAAPWLLAGGAADVVDGVVIAAAMRSGMTRGMAAVVAACAVATGAASIWAARRLRG